jgi:predicted transcriptional regulator of viral defense system
MSKDPPGKDPESRAIEAFRKHAGLLRTRDALDLGIHPRTLYGLRDDGVVVQVSRGLYRLAELPLLSQPDLVTVALRVPRAVICLVSALAYHDATTEIPHEVQIALPRQTKAPRLDFPPIRVFWFSGPALSEGIDVVEIDGVDIRVYDLPKTVVDCFRFRNKLGLDVAIEALNQAVKRKGVQPAEVLRYARLCRIDRVILPYVEATVEALQ